MSKYKLIQLTNENFVDIDANAFLPLGTITRRVNTQSNNPGTFQVSTTGSNVVTIFEPGFYKVTYNASLSAAAAGNVSVSLVTNGTEVVSDTETVAAAEDFANITLVYTIRVCPNCCSAPYNCPVTVQVQLGDVATSATTPSNSNLIVERIY